MAALIERDQLDALISPKFQDLVGPVLGDRLKFIVAQAGASAYGEIALGPEARAAIRAAARTLATTPGISPKFLAAVEGLAKFPDY
jgi:hypothetical protein